MWRFFFFFQETDQVVSVQHINIKWQYRQSVIVYAKTLTTSKLSKAVHVNVKILLENRIEAHFSKEWFLHTLFLPFFFQSKQVAFSEMTQQDTFFCGTQTPFEVINKTLFLLIQALLHNKINKSLLVSKILPGPSLLGQQVSHLWWSAHSSADLHPRLAPNLSHSVPSSRATCASVSSSDAPWVPLTSVQQSIRSPDKGKGKGHFYLTSVVPSVPTRLISMEADGAPSTPPATVSAPFYGYSKL